MKGGFIGVDIFFVISGYLISTIILGSLEQGRFSFSEFYSKRIKRIFPALLLVLFSSYVLGWFVLLPDEYRQLGQHISGGTGFISNFLLWKETGYFDNLAETKPLLHLWSLAIEEQFYVIWPLLLTLVWMRNWGFLTITAAIAALSFATNIYLVGKNPSSAFYLPITRFWELMIGCGLAYLSLHRPHPLHRYRNIQSTFGFALLAIGLLLLDKTRPFPGWWAALPTLGALFIISAGQNAWLNRHILSNKLMVWFGLISYPLYLWHWPILSFIRIIEGQLPLHDWAIRICAVLASILLAWLTYQFMEKPIRNNDYSKAKTPILIGLMILVGIAGYATFRSDGLEFRVKKLVEIPQIKNAPEDLVSENESCEKLFPQFKTFSGCSISHPEAPTIAVIGDSHSRQYYQSLKKALPKKSLINIVSFSCLPFSSKTHQSIDECERKFHATIDFLKGQLSIKTVYLVGYWNYLAAGGFGVVEVGWRQPKPLTTEERLSFQKNGEYFISSLISSGKNVIFIRDIPDLTFSIQSCFYEMPLRFHSIKTKINNHCAMDKLAYERRTRDYDAAINNLLSKFPNIRNFDPKPIFCDKKLCWGIRERRVLYIDGDHPSAFATDVIIKNLLTTFPADN